MIDNFHGQTIVKEWQGTNDYKFLQHKDCMQVLWCKKKSTKHQSWSSRLNQTIH